LTWEQLPALFPRFAEPGRWLPLLRRHAGLIASASGRVRVTSVPPEEAVRRHYAESLELLRIADEAGWEGATADVGSGGGYPGLVFAAVRPDVTAHLIEPLQKRARLLEWLVEELGLEHVQVHAMRAEEAGRGPLRDSCGLVTARAVAGLSEVLEYTAPLTAQGGLIALPKGSALDAEVTGAEPAMKALAASVAARTPMRPVVSERIDVLLLRKLATTPVAYPRRPGMAARRPL
jgi:16S rRNA (guanine527-N7)-methyltransferase